MNKLEPRSYGATQTIRGRNARQVAVCVRIRDIDSWRRRHRIHLAPVSEPKRSLWSKFHLAMFGRAA